MATHSDQGHEDGRSPGDAVAAAGEQTMGQSRKQFLGTVAKAVAGAAAAGAGLHSLPALAASSRFHAPQIMRKGSQVTLTYYFGANAAEAKTRQKAFDQFMAANPDFQIVNQPDGAN